MTEGNRYRLRLATGFLNEARQDVDLERWRSAMDNAQLTVENAGKSVLALLGPVGKTHQPASRLRESVHSELFSEDYHSAVIRLAELCELLGPDIHIQTDYGSETEGLTPWELFSKVDAAEALAMAEEAVQVAEKISLQVSEDADEELP